MRDPFAVVASLGKRLDGTPGAWRDVKAILLVVAREGPQTWNGVAALADALGVSPDLQEQVYREAYHHLAGERTGAATTEKRHQPCQTPPPPPSASSTPRQLVSTAVA